MPVVPPDEATSHHRARVASLSRSRAADDPELIDARRSLREALAAAHIEKAVDKAAPLTTEQRTRLAVVLLGVVLPAGAE